MGFLSLTAVLLVPGQTMAVFDYEMALSFGLQEEAKAISEFGVQINRDFGAGDSIVYLPLVILFIIGLFLKQRRPQLAIAAAMGVSSYWAATRYLVSGGRRSGMRHRLIFDLIRGMTYQ